MARSFFSRKSSRRAAPNGAQIEAEGVPEEPPHADEVPAASPRGEDEQGGDEEEDASVSQPVEDTSDSSSLLDMATALRTQLAASARQDAATAASLAVPLKSLHPGGLAALYADTPTRLSSLVREPTALADITEKVNSLGAFAEEMATRHGGIVMHLVVGSASWGGQRPASHVPVFMRQVVVGSDEDGSATLQLMPGVEVSSRLLREAAAAGVDIDRDLLFEALHGPGGFSPASALDKIAEVGRNIESFRLRDEMSLAILTHPTAALFRDLADVEFLEQSPLLVALNGDRTAQIEAATQPQPANPADRDPWKEVGVGDQSPQVQDVIEQIAGGGSYVVVAENDSDLIAGAVSAAAALAGDGKSVLVVANDQDAYGALAARFEEMRIESVVANFFPDRFDEGVTTLLDTAMRDVAPGLNEAETESMRVGLRRARAALTAYEEQLHAEFEEWGVTPFDALQVLTELTSDPDGPTTRVRLSSETLGLLSEDGAAHARDLLEDASRQGLFSDLGEASGWDDIPLEDAAQVDSVVDATETLAREALPALRVQMARVAGQTGLRTATTLDGWKMQLELIARARTILDTFRPEAFERSPADLVIATATPEWRKQKGITLKGSKRRLLVKQARDLVRPGVHIADLNQALIEVQECRHQWLSASLDDEPWPTIPEGLESCAETLAATEDLLAVCAPYLEQTFGDLGSMALDELCPTLEALADDANGARLVPQRLRVLGELQDLGLGELVDDLRRRRIDGDLIGLELDLAWWASVLGLMLAAEPRLGGFDPDLLQGLVSDVRVLDEAQVASLGLSVVERVKARRRDALALYPEQYTELVASLAGGAAGANLFNQYSLAWDLLPIVCAGPSMVPLLTRRRHSVDVVLVVGASSLSLAETAPVLARADDAVVFARGDAIEDGSWVTRLTEFLTVLELPGKPITVNGHFADLVRKYKPDTSITAVPTPRPPAGIEHIKVGASGMPAPTTVAIESSLGEAEAAANYLIRSLIDEPETSVAVVAFNDRHADRIRVSLRRALAEKPQALSVKPEKLIVLPHELPALSPDHTVLSVGFAKTPHGRVIHDFGVLSTPEGMDVIEAIAQGSGGNLTVITSLESQEIDRSRLRHGGALALVDLLEVAEGRDEAAAEVDSGEHVPDDLLVDLADRLHRLGLPVAANLGTGANRIPLAVGHPEVPGEWLVAVLTDDPSYRSEPSLRVRDRYWPELLERQGWKVRTELSMSVFIDPTREAQHVVELVLDAVDDYYVRIGKPVTPASAATLALEGVELRASKNQAETSPEGVLSGDVAVEGEPAPLDQTEGESEPHLEPEGDPEPQGESEDALQLEAPEVQAEPKGAPEGDPEPLFETVATGDVDSPVPDGAITLSPPNITKGLPLSAYSDDQLDDVAAWLRATSADADEGELVEGMREAIGLRRRGSQSHAILLNVIRRTSGQ